MKSLSTLLVLKLCLLLAPLPAAHAQWDDGYWLLNFDNGTSSTAPPLRVGVDLGDGSGFSFQTLADDNGDGAIHLPRVPVGGGLALGVTHAGGEVTCDLWDLVGAQPTGTTIQKPLLIIAETSRGKRLAPTMATSPSHRLRSRRTPDIPWWMAASPAGPRSAS